MSIWKESKKKNIGTEVSSKVEDNKKRETSEGKTEETTTSLLGYLTTLARVKDYRSAVEEIKKITGEAEKTGSGNESEEKNSELMAGVLKKLVELDRRTTSSPLEKDELEVLREKVAKAINEDSYDELHKEVREGIAEVDDEEAKEFSSQLGKLENAGKDESNTRLGEVSKQRKSSLDSEALRLNEELKDLLIRLSKQFDKKRSGKEVEKIQLIIEKVQSNSENITSKKIKEFKKNLGNALKASQGEGKIDDVEVVGDKSGTKSNKDKIRERLVGIIGKNKLKFVWAENALRTLDDITTKLDAGVSIEDIRWGMGLEDAKRLRLLLNNPELLPLVKQIPGGAWLIEQVSRYPTKDEFEARSERLSQEAESGESKVKHIGGYQKEGQGYWGLRDLTGLMDGELPDELFENIDSDGDYEELMKKIKAQGAKMHKPRMSYVDYDNAVKSGYIKKEWIGKYLEGEDGELVEPPRMKKELFTNESLRLQFFEEWKQSAWVALREIAYEGLEGQSMYTDDRGNGLISLFSIMGVDSEVKGRVKLDQKLFGAADKAFHAYITKDGVAQIFSPLSEQGWGFRADKLLADRENLHYRNQKGEFVELKGNDKEPVGVNIYDFLTKMGELVPQEMKAKLGIPEDMESLWGTTVFRYGNSEYKIKMVSELFRDILKDRGVIVEDDALKSIVKYYGEYVDKSFVYAAANGMTSLIVGNASLEWDKFEFCQGIPEYYYKIDPHLCRYFLAKYDIGGVPEFYALVSAGVRDKISMFPTEKANHFVSLNDEKGNPGILKMYYGGKINSMPYATKLREVFKEALFHYGHSTHDDVTSFFTKIGDKDNPATAMRRQIWAIRENLSKHYPGQQAVEAIDWTAYLEWVNDKRINKLIMNAVDEAKRIKAKMLFSEDANKQAELVNNYGIAIESIWKAFATTFSEHSFYSIGDNEKRPDYPQKYILERGDGAFSQAIPFSRDPKNPKNLLGMTDLFTSVNAGGVDAYVSDVVTVLSELNEEVGTKIAGIRQGEGVKLVKKESGKIVFSSKRGVGSVGIIEGNNPRDSQRRDALNHMMPGLDSFEYIRTSLNPRAPKTGSEYYGQGRMTPEALRSFLEDLWSNQIIKDRKKYEKMINDWTKGLAWEGKKGLLPNIWRWIKLDPIFDYIAVEYLDIRGDQLRDIFLEQTGKTASNFWKYMNS